MNSSALPPLKIAAFLGFLAVALGAFGAHALRPILEQHQTTAIWQTASFYHLTHSIVLLVLSLLLPQAKIPFRLFFGGILVFSGSLYLLGVTGARFLGAITPLGGLLLLAGWLSLLFQPRSTS